VDVRHDPPARPRYGRLAALGSSLCVTLVAVLGGTGVLPSTAAVKAEGGSGHPAQIAPASGSVSEPATAPAGSPGSPDSRESRLQPGDTALPDGSGSGRRVVFSEGRQRVWLVAADNEVRRTYLVSGSIYDNLDPGSFEVYSRSRQAWGIDDSGTMKYFVRFTQGDNAAIGFHDIPVDDGKPVQSVDQLGTPLSHGCVRQRRADAIALWRFAPLVTKVVVTA
jgi:lipoprotein-anchoring transpeptidase ErfK/SrfK